MITIRSGLEYKPADLDKKQYNSASEALSLIHNHLLPLHESSNSADNALYIRAFSGLSHLSKSHKLNGILEPLAGEISNWDFIQSLAFCWKNCGFIDSRNRDISPKDLTARYSLEDVGVRALARYDVIYTCLFRDQTHYSIFGWNISLLNKSLREILKSHGRI